LKNHWLSQELQYVLPGFILSCNSTALIFAERSLSAQFIVHVQAASAVRA